MRVRISPSAQKHYVAMKSSNTERHHSVNVRRESNRIAIFSGETEIGEITISTAFDGENPTDAFYLTLTPQGGKLQGKNGIYHNPNY